MTSASYRSPVRPHSRWVTKVGRSPPVHAPLVKSVSLAKLGERLPQNRYDAPAMADYEARPRPGLRRSALRQGCQQSETAAIAAVVEMHQVARAIRRASRKIPAPRQ